MKKILLPLFLAFTIGANCTEKSILKGKISQQQVQPVNQNVRQKTNNLKLAQELRTSIIYLYEIKGSREGEVVNNLESGLLYGFSFAFHNELDIAQKCLKFVEENIDKVKNQQEKEGYNITYNIVKAYLTAKTEGVLSLEARMRLENAVNICERNGFYEGAADCYRRNAKILKEENKLAEAINYNLKSAEQYKKDPAHLDRNDMICHIFEQLSELYCLKGDTLKSKEFKQKADSTANEYEKFFRERFPIEIEE